MDEFSAGIVMDAETKKLWEEKNGAAEGNERE